MLNILSTSFLAVAPLADEAAVARHRQGIRSYIDLCVRGLLASAACNCGADEALAGLLSPSHGLPAYSRPMLVEFVLCVLLAGRDLSWWMEVLQAAEAPPLTDPTFVRNVLERLWHHSSCAKLIPHFSTRAGVAWVRYGSSQA